MSTKTNNQLNSIKRTTSISPTWCPGCGNFSIIASLKTALDQLKLEPHQTVFVYDIGCSGNMADFVFSYGFHALHGRTLPLAAGIKLANHQLKVFCIIGDGGCYGEGIGHLIDLARGNHDLTVIVHNNLSYSLTTGQKSPTTPKGTITPSTPFGTIDQPFNPIATALVNHATFVSRGLAGDTSGLTELIVSAANHSGFALIDVLQPCPTYQKTYTYQWYLDHSYQLKTKNHNPADLQLALKASQPSTPIALGIFYQASKPAYHQQLPTLKTKTLVSQTIASVDLNQLLTKLS